MMQVHEHIEQLPTFTNAVVTIGTFDGVHLGHKAIIDQLKRTAQEIGGETVIITFDPHPRTIISSVPGDLKLLTLIHEKARLLNEAGIDHLVVVPFNTAFAMQCADDYIRAFLFEKFKPHTIIIGYDHRFGKGRNGDFTMLEAYGRELGFTVDEIEGQNVAEVVVSSTKVRNALLESNIEKANAYLGYPYFFSGKVIAGNQLGRTIGFPTANLQIAAAEKLIPGNGVYAVTAILNKNNVFSTYKGMMNIGFRPTVDGKRRMIEVNLLEFSDDIYECSLEVHVHAFIRGEVKFDGIEALKAQLQKDAVVARELLTTIG
ncbi:MAG: bifunctional riboflavin kinase/FAD synthetase [Chitinophagaceae bacterium]|nr:bifunctional riboflavin kinase/FAD synthetase [Chitinophagaceae bacterium]